MIAFYQDLVAAVVLLPLVFVYDVPMGAERYYVVGVSRRGILVILDNQ